MVSFPDAKIVEIRLSCAPAQLRHLRIEHNSAGDAYLFARRLADWVVNNQLWDSTVIEFTYTTGIHLDHAWLLFPEYVWREKTSLMFEQWMEVNLYIPDDVELRAHFMLAVGMPIVEA